MIGHVWSEVFMTRFEGSHVASGGSYSPCRGTYIKSVVTHVPDEGGEGGQGIVVV